MNLVQQAEQVARVAHVGVDRKSGEAYIEHPRRVAEALAAAGFSDEVVAAAWLHDTVEDTGLTLAILRALGFPERTVSAVDSVTHRPGETVVQSVARAAAHEDGRWIKLADNADNSAPAQLAIFPFAERIRREIKYVTGRHLLLASVYGDLAAA